MLAVSRDEGLQILFVNPDRASDPHGRQLPRRHQFVRFCTPARKTLLDLRDCEEAAKLFPFHPFLSSRRSRLLQRLLTLAF